MTVANTATRAIGLADATFDAPRCEFDTFGFPGRQRELSQLKPCTCLRLLASQCKEGPEDSSSVTCMLREKRSGICDMGFLVFLV